MREAISRRISRRTYRDPLDMDEIREIRELIDDVNRASGLTLALETDAEKAFSSKKYTKGFIHHATSVILMKGPSDMQDLKEKIGYYGEGLVLDLVDRDYGTCWVAGTMDRSVFSVDDNETLVCVVIVGNVGTQDVSEKTIRSMIRMSVKKPGEMITGDREIPEWIMAAMEAVVKAPSAVNRQKPRFRFFNNVLTADVPDDYVMDLVDLGIAKRHFVEIAGGYFDFGNGAAYHGADQ
ncbi:MAG: nitroreductase family protein [Firmicutes bacterium]|nr:nitroreductase family protein [Bacillota bacterium]